MKFATSILVATLFAAVGLAQEVKFEKYTLDNGMTVILHEDHALPVATINTWYYVGSKDEPVGRSGFAHLFEHLMFMGTERVPGGNFDTIMENGGGNNNASTAFDRTNYYSSGPSSLLPTLLWLDADRLEDLGRTMTQEKLDRQREIVRNERRQSIENAPYGKAELLITAIMYPGDHPYHNEVIGTHEDLEAAQVTDVKDFFANFYVPNNASLVIAGDFDPAKIKPLVANLFGTIKAGQEPIHKTAAPVKLDTVIRTTTLDQVQLAKVCMVYHSPANYAAGDAEMDLVGAVLSQGKSSRLYKRLVEEDKVAVDVAAYQNSSKLQGTFRIDITVQPGVDLALVEKTVDEEVGKLLSSGVTKAELDQRVATIELGKLAQLQSVQSKADKLNEYEFYFGKPDGFKRDLDRYRNATPAAVQEWAKKIITQNARLIVQILPDQPQRGTTPRDERPSDSAAADFSPSAPQTFSLTSGVKVMFWARPELPLVSAQIVFHPGGPLDAPEQAGRSALTATMLEEGAGDLNAVQFADTMQSLGAVFGSGASTETATVSLTVLKRNFPLAFGLLADAVKRPRMEQQDWDRVVRLHIEDLKEQDDSPQLLAGRIGQRVFFGPSSPYAWPVSGTPETVKGLKLEDIRAHHSDLYTPHAATILLAGDLSLEDARSILERQFGRWQSKPFDRMIPTPAASKPLDSMKVVIVDRPGAVQTVIRFIAPGIPFTGNDRVKLSVLNELFGGGFTSRINQNLREKHGYTYGAASRFVMEPGTGYFMANSSVRADVTGESLKEFLGEFKRIRAGDISAEEVGKATQSQRTEMIQRFAGLSGVLGASAERVAAGLPFESISADMEALKSVDMAQANELAGPAFSIDHGVLVLVGDKATIMEQIKGLDLPEPVEYTIKGEPK